MTISSRTPEGQPNRCPVCGHAVQIEPSTPFGDAPCPCCGCPLWFVPYNSSVQYFDHEVSGAIRDRIRAAFASHLGVSLDKIPLHLEDADFSDFGLDSLDVVELMMEIEEELDISIEGNGYD